ncbi:heavy-metal-associated domain-containing protein [Hyphomonas sp. NPDC076900]|uniref:heavy-metal-associated domain-containing protein n=1 Tax=unclassified Hyphomonas TaxID=2630699 RepID=UPI003D08FD1A
MNTLKTLALALALCLASAPALAAPSAPAVTQAKGEFVTAHVNGLVCDFCAQAIQKVFKKEAAVKGVHVDLGKGEVHISMNPGQTLDDATIEKLIRNSGYALTGIDREVAE